MVGSLSQRVGGVQLGQKRVDNELEMFQFYVLVWALMWPAAFVALVESSVLDERGLWNHRTPFSSSGLSTCVIKCVKVQPRWQAGATLDTP